MAPPQTPKSYTATTTSPDSSGNKTSSNTSPLSSSSTTTTISPLPSLTLHLPLHRHHATLVTLCRAVLHPRNPRSRFSPIIAASSVLHLQGRLNAYFAVQREQREQHGHDKREAECREGASGLDVRLVMRKPDQEKEEEEEEEEEGEGGIENKMVLQMQVLLQLLEMGLGMRRGGVAWPCLGRANEGATMTRVYEDVDDLVFGWDGRVKRGTRLDGWEI
ncbi:hypothetical protein J1614_010203 [Plenodomus biglobosus]|nr:hypothetical protein J1614_010203 [Plenodomus biglobosus]